MAHCGTSFLSKVIHSQKQSGFWPTLYYGLLLAVHDVLRFASTAQHPAASSIVCFPEPAVVALVLARLDYGNATLAGLPANLLNRLQSVLDARARSIASLNCSAHTTDTLVSFSGYVPPSQSSSNWRLSYSELFAALRLDI